MPKDTSIKKILVIGSGPIVIGQGCEFDYSGTQACKALREEGYEVVLVNSNPATIMTDPETAPRTYIEPITPEFVEKIIIREKPDALLPTLGGQTALNCAMELHRSGVLESFFNAISQDGKLYWITNSFNLVTLAGPGAVVGTEPGWSYAELYAALDQMPEGCDILSLGTTKQSVFDSICNLNLDSFVDWGTGVCSFDSEEFINLLKFTDLFPAEFDWQNYEWTQNDSDDVRIKEGRQLLMSLSVGYPSDLVYYKGYFEGGMTLIGFPDVPGSGSVFSTYSPGFAISETCKEKDAAWRFVSGFLKEDFQNNYGSYGFSVNRKLFDKSFQDALGQEFNNYVMDASGEYVNQTITFTQEDMDMLLDVINNTQLFGQSYASTQDQLQKIVSEEVSSYFAGEKSAEDVAAMIQNRASIYVSEQR